VKNLKVSIKLVLMLLAVFIVVPTAQASPTSDFPKDRQVLEAVSLIYAPMPDNRSSWLEAVCQRMTEGGCGYFTDQLESRLWQNGQDVALNSAWPFGAVATLDDGSQVWKAAMATYKSCGDALKNCLSIESDLYLHVVYGEAQDEWLLNRVLYGPYIKEK
jgi:hypothetical protein